MKNLSPLQMESLSGGQLPQWLRCGGAVVSTTLFFGSILAGNLGAALYGPTLLGIAWAGCAA